MSNNQYDLIFSHFTVLKFQKFHIIGFLFAGGTRRTGAFGDKKPWY